MEVTEALRIPLDPARVRDALADLAQISRAMDAAERHGVPVVVVQNFAPAGAPIFVRCSQLAELHETVASWPRAHYLEKSLPSAFAGTDLADWLKRNEIDTLTIAGYMTHNCDDSTVKYAVHASLSVEFLTDATGSVPYENRVGRATAEEIHRVFTVVMQSRFATVLTTDEWIAALESGEPPARDNHLCVESAGALRRVLIGKRRAPGVRRRASRAGRGCSAARRSRRR